MSHFTYKVETEIETDGRWIAEVMDLPGVMAYGATEKEAIASAQALQVHTNGLSCMVDFVYVTEAASGGDLSAVSLPESKRAHHEDSRTGVSLAGR